MRISPNPWPSGLAAKERPSPRPGTLHSLAQHIALWLLAPLALSFASVTAVAQVSPQCPPPPNSPNYPCAYVANNGSSTVSVIFTPPTDPLATISLSSEPLPNAVAISPDNKYAYVTADATQALVVVIGTEKGNIVTSVVTAAAATQIAVGTTPNGTQAWVVEGSQIERIDTTSNMLVPPAVDLSGQAMTATAVAFAPDGRTAYVAGNCGFFGGSPCMAQVDTTMLTVAVPMQFMDGETSQAYSIAVTPDGKYACMSVNRFIDDNLTNNYVVYCLDVANNSINEIPTGINANPSNLGFGITPKGVLYAAAPTFGDDLNQVFVFDTSSQMFKGTITVGNAPTGVAVTAAGDAVYVTNRDSASVSVIDPNFGVVNTIMLSQQSPLGVAAMPSIPPAITTQPADQTIPYGGMATLTVAATGTAPLMYQWYQGQMEDTSNPIQGANGTSFTTPALTTTTSYWVRVTNIVKGANADSRTATVTVLPAQPPTITTQPANQLIGIGSEATLSVQATGNPPPSYQWFQGQSGDTSMPLQGATGTSFTTPPLITNTSYWVQVSNVGGMVNSNTATVTVSQVPTCALTLQAAGGSQTAVTATAMCTDHTIPPLALTTTLDWGDNSPTVTVSGGSLTATHTYLNVTKYTLVVTAVNSDNIQGVQPAILDLRPVVQPLSVFQGQSTSFMATVSSPGMPQADVNVNFECTVVLTSNNVVIPAAQVGISCYAISQPLTIPAGGSISPTIVIQTSGGALARLSRPKPLGALYACLMPFFGLVFLPGGASLFIRRRNLQRLVALVGILSLVVFLTSCGGGFTPPHNQTATPPDTYTVSVVDVPADNSAPPGAFVQTTLIVPLRVDQFQ